MELSSILTEDVGIHLVLIAHAILLGHLGKFRKANRIDSLPVLADEFSNLLERDLTFLIDKTSYGFVIKVDSVLCWTLVRSALRSDRTAFSSLDVQVVFYVVFKTILVGFGLFVYCINDGNPLFPEEVVVRT